MLNGEWDFEMIRERGGGVQTVPMTGRHLHNFAHTDKQLTEKYKHYNHPCVVQDQMCHEETWPEVRWRCCEKTAPDLSPSGWYTKWTPEVASPLIRHTVTTILTTATSSTLI